jgi:hypothetical protein
MALIHELTRQVLQISSRHSVVDCTFDVIRAEDGVLYLQLDTYGSKARKIPGKKSQSLRFSPSAIAQLKQILQEHQL